MQLAVGLGCDRGTPLATLQQALGEALALAGACLADVAGAASIDLKADEPGLLALAAQHGWRMNFYTPAQLAAVPVPNPSEMVRKHTGSPSVSEAAALLAASAAGQVLPGTALLVEKHKHKGADGRNATVSLARCHDFFL
ncbi:MAG: cobalamin [Polaromonas sp.]|nr:cobalamin [Polaromonas sp.]